MGLKTVGRVGSVYNEFEYTFFFVVIIFTRSYYRN